MQLTKMILTIVPMFRCVDKNQDSVPGSGLTVNVLLQVQRSTIQKPLVQECLVHLMIHRRTYMCSLHQVKKNTQYAALCTVVQLAQVFVVFVVQVSGTA